MKDPETLVRSPLPSVPYLDTFECPNFPQISPWLYSLALGSLLYVSTYLLLWGAVGFHYHTVFFSSVCAFPTCVGSELGETDEHLVLVLQVAPRQVRIDTVIVNKVCSASSEIKDQGPTLRTEAAIFKMSASQPGTGWGKGK